MSVPVPVPLCMSSRVLSVLYLLVSYGGQLQAVTGMVLHFVVCCASNPCMQTPGLLQKAVGRWGGQLAVSSEALPDRT